jgi:hypothetical protein
VTASEGAGTALIHELRVLAAAALGMLDVGDVDGAKAMLRKALSRRLP